MQADTVDKIIRSYFTAVTSTPFTYKGVEYQPQTLVVSPLVWRGYTCPPKCGGCCGVFTLDYLPSEAQPPHTVRRHIDFNDERVVVYTEVPRPAESEMVGKCHYLRVADGRCKIHDHNPFSCDFELTRFFHPGERGKFYIRTQLYGRGWNMKRVDGDRGALCEITPVDTASWRDSLRKLRRLQEWTNHFGLTTRLPAILEWGAAGPTQEPLIFNL
jgi:Fe-S-cluster containining protein